ncbi:signal transduction histidine kinase [Belliella baltica DSM 15883]|uniref:histidine kinase n=1 Tax=Belliella baltica (strain DSM 15883 / CIP 108006 / LMG 21964 / BA134) TaxID=866536 RepID=I3Z7E0_BELBD|nr:HAMP domain-containing sensor histidine kinase [Belliella baltica]AFL85158.1 signal transduction histidine kinase [Belliella baltica DSM 15883]
MNNILKSFYSLPGLKRSYALKFFVITFLGIHIPLIGLSIFLLVLPNEIESLTIFWIVLGFTLLGTALTLYILNYLIKPIQKADQALLQYISDRKIPKLSIEGEDELVRLLQSMEKTILRTEELIDQKNDLIYLLSHDLRAPIVKARGVFELLKTETDREFVEDISNQLATEMNAQLDLIESLLRLLQDEHNSREIPRIDMEDFQAVLDEVLKSSQNQIEEKNLKVEVSINGNSQILAEKVLVRQLILNLLSNAIKFSKDGGSIKLEGNGKINSFLFQVKDEGIGFDPRLTSRFFQKFSSYQKEGTNGEKSTGLGLYISRKIAERYGAKLSAYSPGEDKGAVFEVEFPSK